MKRFWNWLKALFNQGMDKLEDPEMMLEQARRDMQKALVENREKAVSAITQKNRLEGMLEEQTRKAEQLESQAGTALRQGNRDLAKQFLREKASLDQTITTLRTSLSQATETVEAVKIAIRRQEQEIKTKTAEVLAMKAQWKQAQIQESLQKAMDGLTFESEYESTFASAKERIAQKQAEARARQEMSAGSITGKMMDMEDQAMDYEAEDELRKLEEKLGLATPVTQQQAAPAQDIDLDSQLDDLENRLNNQNG
jgi:phage shock protein A